MLTDIVIGRQQVLPIEALGGVQPYGHSLTQILMYRPLYMILEHWHPSYRMNIIVYQIS